MDPPKEPYKLRLNFITIHYVYIIGMVLLGSIVIYPKRNMGYVDALFFASGATTQSGLNTIDVNKIPLYQQVTIYLIAMFTTPIFIHTMVVFVRLHWFEKRFEHIVETSRLSSKARTLSVARNKEDGDSEERGVGGREITVLHLNDGELGSARGNNGVNQPSSPASNISIREPAAEPLSELRPGTSATASNIHFADAPSPRERADSLSRHIAFVESQRQLHNGKTLKVPGPRDFEKGESFREVDDDDANTLDRTKTREFDRNNETASGYLSLGKAATNASSLRIRRLPTADRFLPHATTMLSNAFSVGTANKHYRTFSRTTSKEIPHMPYLSYRPAVGRNSQFIDLTEEQREELGGIEYRSLKLLAKILCYYYVIFHILGVVCLLPWMLNAPSYESYVRSVGVNPTWWAIFTSQSAFNDLGFTLTPDSMVSFQKATWVLLACTWLIIIGNTGFPCLLRFIIWVMFKLAPKNSAIRESLNFLLDHPRRCFTLLFPSRETWVLFWVLVILNGADVILFIVLDLKNKDVLSISVGHRIIDAIFQAASTRTAGLAVVNIADLHPAVQVSYMVMMYISIFPIAISVRRTNVYEETSLGIYSSDDDEEAERTSSYVGVHLRKQLSFDLWYIFLGLFIICIAEGTHIADTKEYAFTVFAVLFEVVSAYGTVGLSLGYPNTNTSFSAMFSTVSRLVIIAMQIRGRHRGLPYEVDRAILLPKDRRDDEHVSIRRRNSNLSAATGPRMFGPASQSQAVED